MDVLIVSAKRSATEMHKKMPVDIIATLLAANNQVLKAAIIENGGELVIYPESLYEMFQNTQHVVASSDDTGCIRLSMATKKIIDQSESVLCPL